MQSYLLSGSSLSLILCYLNSFEAKNKLEQFSENIYLASEDL